MENKSAINILRSLYEAKYETDEFDYDTVDNFYAYLGYDLELQNVLYEMNIDGTSDLQEALLGSD